MRFWEMIGLDNTLGLPIEGHYHPGLVVLSIIVVSLAALSSLSVVGRMMATNAGFIRRFWHLIGGISMGCGIWAMHFTGMLAFTLPVNVTYDTTLTALSVLPGIVGSLCLLHFMARPTISFWRLQAGALLMALGIGGMHYTGMDAMSMSATMRYDTTLFYVSILVAHALASATLYIRFKLPVGDSRINTSKLVAACAMGCAVGGMHYIAMAAAHYYSAFNIPVEAMDMSPRILALIIASLAILFIGITLYVSIVDERLSKTSESLQESEARHRAIFATLRDGLITLDSRNKIESMNPSAERMFGIKQETALGMNFLELFDEKVNFSSADESVTSNTSDVPHRLHGKRKDGSLFPIDLVTSSLTLSNEQLHSAVIRDLSARVALEAELVQARKLEAVGSLAAGIAHEINTPIQYVGDNTNFLSDSFESLITLIESYESLWQEANTGGDLANLDSKRDKAKENAELKYLREEIPTAIEQTLDGVRRVSKIVRAMKDFSRSDQGLKTISSISEMLESTLTVAQNELKYVADVEINFDQTIPEVECYREELNQVFLNLLINAAHAIKDIVGDPPDSKGIITVSTLRENNNVIIKISDTGTGIPPSIQDRIFDPFFSTKDVGKGSGQGLHIARKIVVEKHKGRLDFETEEGKGATFIICLPITIQEVVEV